MVNKWNVRDMGHVNQTYVPAGTLSVEIPRHNAPLNTVSKSAILQLDAETGVATSLLGTRLKVFVRQNDNVVPGGNVVRSKEIDFVRQHRFRNGTVRNLRIMRTVGDETNTRIEINVLDHYNNYAMKGANMDSTSNVTGGTIARKP